MTPQRASRAATGVSAAVPSFRGDLVIASHDRKMRRTIISGELLRFTLPFAFRFQMIGIDSTNLQLIRFIPITFQASSGGRNDFAAEGEESKHSL